MKQLPTRNHEAHAFSDTHKSSQLNLCELLLMLHHRPFRQKHGLPNSMCMVLMIGTDKTYLFLPSIMANFAFWDTFGALLRIQTYNLWTIMCCSSTQPIPTVALGSTFKIIFKKTYIISKGSNSWFQCSDISNRNMQTEANSLSETVCAYWIK